MPRDRDRDRLPSNSPSSSSSPYPKPKQTPQSLGHQTPRARSGSCSHAGSVSGASRLSASPAAQSAAGEVVPCTASASPPAQLAQPAAPLVGPAPAPPAQEAGFSAWVVCSADPQVKLYYVSESMQEILGWTPAEMVGRSLYDWFHPDELTQMRQSHYSTLADEKLACVAYFRVRHRDGSYVHCWVSYSTVYDMCVGLYTRAVEGQRTLRQVSTAREVFEITPALTKRFADSVSVDSAAPPPCVHPSPTPRTFYIIDRFTATSRVMYVSNDLIVNGSSVQNQSFYSMIRPSDRQLVRGYIEAAKQATPIQYNDQRSGGHEFATFYMLKIPDLPPSDAAWPQGTDASERSMPGQEFVLVEGMFTAGSDGLACVIERVDKGKQRERDRARERDKETERERELEREREREEERKRREEWHRGRGKEVKRER